MRMNRVTLTLAAVLIMLLPAAPPAAAQDTGTISGTVVDASAPVLRGATVTLVNEATGDARTIVTSDRGDFTFRHQRRRIVNDSWDLPGRHSGPMKLVLGRLRFHGRPSRHRRLHQRQRAVSAHRPAGPRGRSPRGRRRSAHRILQHRRVRASDARQLRHRAPQRGEETGPRQHERRDVQERQPERRPAVPRGNLQPVQPVEFQDIDRTARFDANGNQINPTFGGDRHHQPDKAAACDSNCRRGSTSERRVSACGHAGPQRAFKRCGQGVSGRRARK